MPDRIPPPSAPTAESLLPMCCAALSAGDVDAALSLYADDAVLAPWELPPLTGPRLRDVLVSLAALKVPLRAGVDRVAPMGDGALVRGRWTADATWGMDLAASGTPLRLGAVVTAVAQRQPNGWRYVLECWSVPPA